ncbi:hypothetical protein ACOME3_006214 [Neoechinorhynchus agilis]
MVTNYEVIENTEMPMAPPTVALGCDCSNPRCLKKICLQIRSSYSSECCDVFQCCSSTMRADECECSCHLLCDRPFCVSSIRRSSSFDRDRLVNDEWKNGLRAYLDVPRRDSPKRSPIKTNEKSKELPKSLTEKHDDTPSISPGDEDKRSFDSLNSQEFDEESSSKNERRTKREDKPSLDERSPLSDENYSYESDNQSLLDSPQKEESYLGVLSSDDNPSMNSLSSDGSSVPSQADTLSMDFSPADSDADQSNLSSSEDDGSPTSTTSDNVSDESLISSDDPSYLSENSLNPSVEGQLSPVRSLESTELNKLSDQSGKRSQESRPALRRKYKVSSKTKIDVSAYDYSSPDRRSVTQKRADIKKHLFRVSSKTKLNLDHSDYFSPESPTTKTRRQDDNRTEHSARKHSNIKPKRDYHDPHHYNISSKTEINVDESNHLHSKPRPAKPKGLNEREWFESSPIAKDVNQSDYSQPERRSTKSRRSGNEEKFESSPGFKDDDVNQSDYSQPERRSTKSRRSGNEEKFESSPGFKDDDVNQSDYSQPERRSTKSRRSGNEEKFESSPGFKDDDVNQSDYSQPERRSTKPRRTGNEEKFESSPGFKDDDVNQSDYSQPERRSTKSRRSGNEEKFESSPRFKDDDVNQSDYSQPERRSTKPRRTGNEEKFESSPRFKDDDVNQSDYSQPERRSTKPRRTGNEEKFESSPRFKDDDVNQSDHFQPERRSTKLGKSNEDKSQQHNFPLNTKSDINHSESLPSEDELLRHRRSNNHHISSNSIIDFNEPGSQVLERISPEKLANRTQSRRGEFRNVTSNASNYLTINKLLSNGSSVSMRNCIESSEKEIYSQKPNTSMAMIKSNILADNDSKDLTSNEETPSKTVLTNSKKNKSSSFHGNSLMFEMQSNEDLRKKSELGNLLHEPKSQLNIHEIVSTSKGNDSDINPRVSRNTTARLFHVLQSNNQLYFKPDFSRFNQSRTISPLTGDEIKPKRVIIGGKIKALILHLYRTSTMIDSETRLRSSNLSCDGYNPIGDFK